MFDRLIHADWSVDARKRWQASAERRRGAWYVSAPRPVGSVSDFLDEVFAYSARDRVLMGFDFPIGVPNAYGVKTGLASFRDALFEFGRGGWAGFFDIADRPEEISVSSPSYPRGCRKGVSRNSLVSGLGVNSFADLLRICERRTTHGPEGCSLFWTLGGNQVGRAAIAGWREVVRPALERGAALWPFDGSLAALSAKPGVVLAETYPAAAYRMFGANFHRGESKRRRSDRASKASAILDWATAHAVHLSDDTKAAVLHGFGDARSGEDAFDALAGLLKIVEIVDGRGPEAPQDLSAVLTWEGWILGR
ncbi:DUF429 domain-containing protein [Microvirga massiliensis]|uniref:DUF429 domain-containing protein n=1 Tax=Microvirga massiliensis TaxID=1033741 RepID=UPI00062BA9BE|nr:DUF429 domain-containing protein [Microvirga massiliensis]